MNLKKPFQLPAVESAYIFLTLDRQQIPGYFNEHDPAPLYKRQLSNQFEDYLLKGLQATKPFSVIFYKLFYGTDYDKQYAGPLLLAIRNHFDEKRKAKQKELRRFKTRAWLLLAASVVVAFIIYWVLPQFFSEEEVPIGISHSLEVFSWVILWNPLDELLFNFKPILKEMNLMKKLANAGSVLVENEKKIAASPAFKVA